VLRPVCDYEGKTVLVTAGGTSEPIDPVRFITNRSSGKMGVSIAEKALARGAEVILVAGSISVPIPDGVEVIRVETTQQMHDAVMANLSRADVIIKAAAPSDYKVASASDKKLKGESLTLTLSKNPDIAAAVGKVKGDKKLVVFAAETNDCENNAREKFVKKNADMAVLNDVSKPGVGFNVDTNEVTIITKNNEEKLPLMQKSKLADVLLDRILKL
jgi:phosphopantothenoylcysteine decarboxylase/phosphopantothenate--cysteine ligase